MSNQENPINQAPEKDYSVDPTERIFTYILRNHLMIIAIFLLGYIAMQEVRQTTAMRGTSLQNKLSVRLLMLTFVRTGEMRQAKWEDIDVEAKEWRLPAHTTKMRDLHIVPLSKQAISVFKQLHELTGSSPYLLPSQHRQKNPIMSENTINMVIHKMGYKNKS